MQQDRLPGHPLIWVLIGSEILVFALALTGFLVMRLLDRQGFQAAAQLLHTEIGLLSMAVLLTSGYLAALAKNQSRLGKLRRSGALLLAAAALGTLFLVLKFFEYSDLWTQGISLDGSQFFTLYALVTGFHAAHVVFGTGLLLLVALQARPSHVEPVVAFWHMVDLVWVLVFPVVYLVPR